MKDSRDLALIAVLFLAVMFYLARRKPMTSTQVNIGPPKEYGQEGVPLGPREAMNTALVRICTYEKSAIEWRLGDACPPNFNGQNLLTDALSVKIPYLGGGQGLPINAFAQTATGNY